MSKIEPGRIRTQDLGRHFSIAAQGGRSLKATLLRHDLIQPREFWAVRHVDLDIAPGETFGIVGRNGSGKSTLLKMLARIFGPSEGSCEVGGRLSSLLELGAGFHPGYSAIENIYLSAAIYGIPKSDVRRDIESILDFAELEEFKDQPVRTFSSGMFARLGFSVAMHVKPDVLLLDEVLSVGDEAFVQKCMGRIAEYRRNGGTMMLVSHDHASIQRSCDRALLLNHGTPQMVGDAPAVIREYHAQLAHTEVPQAQAVHVAHDETISLSSTTARLRITDATGAERSSFVEGEPLSITVTVESAMEIEAADIIIVVTDEAGRGVAGSRVSGVHLPASRTVETTFDVPSPPFREGTFGLNLGVRTTDSQERLFHHAGVATLSFFSDDALGGGTIRLGGTWSTT